MATEIKLLLKPEVAMNYARQLRSYCANQENCKECALHRPERYPYDSKCAIAEEFRLPETWELD